MPKRVKQVSPASRAAPLSTEQKTLVTAIIAEAMVAARQDVATPAQAPAQSNADKAAAQYGQIKRALRTHSESIG